MRRVVIGRGWKVAGSGERQLREALRRWRAMKVSAAPKEGSASPGCVYGLMTRDAIDDLAAEVEDVKAELKWVRATIIAAIVTAAIGTLVKLAGW
jgi:hypothetical protein